MKNNFEETAKFKAGIDGLKKISMTPRQKGEILHRLVKYAEKNPGAEKLSWTQIIFRPLRNLFSLISWR